MLTLPDFKEKKILYISNSLDFPNDLKFRNNNIRLYKNKKFINQLTLFSIFSIFIIGDSTITSKVIQVCKQKGISIFMLNNSFKCYAEIISSADGNYLLRQKQYLAGEKESIDISKLLVENKIRNQIKILKYYKKDLSDFNYKNIISKVRNSDDHNKLLGFEGLASRKYFKLLFSELNWRRRSPQTKEDIDNLLLDIGYTFLFNYIDSLLNLFGFDTYKGYYHQLFFQRKSLSCDLMEPIRPIIDKEILKMHKLNEIDIEDFIFKNQQFRFKDYKTQKKYVDIWFSLIIQYREEMYTYIHNFYQYISDPVKYKFKEFKIR
jgi:CRISPR-associated protein Cas1